MRLGPTRPGLVTWAKLVPRIHTPFRHCAGSPQILRSISFATTFGLANRFVARKWTSVARRNLPAQVLPSNSHVGPGIRSAKNTHGNGVNIDDFGSRDSRRIIPGVCFSIEPGIYLKESLGFDGSQRLRFG